MLFHRIKGKWCRWCARYKTQRSDPSSALAYCQQILKQFPEDAFILCCAGLCLSKQRQYQDAITYYDHALQATPNYGDAHALLGRALLSMDKPQEALESFSRAFRIQPTLRKSFDYQGAFAKSLSELGRGEEALAAFCDAAKFNSTNGEAQAWFGWALMEAGRCKEATKPLRAAIRFDPDYAYSYCWLARTLQELEKYEESIPFAERFVALMPNDSDGYVRLGWGLGRAGRCPEAIRAYNRALELKPDDGAALYEIGLFHYEVGDYSQAIEALEKSIPTQPHSASCAHEMIAAAQMMLGDLPGAIQAHEEAVKLDPDFSEAWHNLGQCYMETGQVEKAITCLKRVLQLGPGIPDTHYLLGLAQFKLGNKPAALEHCEALAKVDNDKAQRLRLAFSEEKC
jgi:tetratricopeptide (TPR) repeat protein